MISYYGYYLISKFLIVNIMLNINSYNMSIRTQPNAQEMQCLFLTMPCYTFSTQLWASFISYALYATYLLK